MPDSVHQTLGAHGAQIENLEDGLAEFKKEYRQDAGEIRASLARLEQLAAEVKGGKKALVVIAAFIGTLIGWGLAVFMGRHP